LLFLGRCFDCYCCDENKTVTPINKDQSITENVEKPQKRAQKRPKNTEKRQKKAEKRQKNNKKQSKSAEKTQEISVPDWNNIDGDKQDENEFIFDFGTEEQEFEFVPKDDPKKEEKENRKDGKKQDKQEDAVFEFAAEKTKEPADEMPMFIVSKIADSETPAQITPVSVAEPAVKTANKPETVISSEERASNIARLAEEIERKRQSNIAITDGKKENKFGEGLFETTKTEGQPKVVARTITETVTARPADTAPKMGFTAQRIVETKTTDRSYTGTGVSSRTTTTVGGSSSVSVQTDSKKKTDDILAALEKLRNSMKRP
jgi:hypothetical protein